MMVSPLIDTHCHLTMGKLGENVDDVLARARAVGVERMLVVGITAENCAEVVELAEPRDGVYCILGIHPCETARASERDWDTVCRLARNRKVVGIGETGIDLYWDDSPQAVQEEWLERHIELALELARPLVLHLRDGFAPAREVLGRHVARGLTGVIHCFGGEADDVHPFLEWGWPISFSGILTYSKAENVREAARRTPLPQCLVETDAPYLAPRPHGGTNEPSYVVATARKLAEVKDVSFEEVAAVTTANAERVFGLAAAAEAGAAGSETP